MVENETDCPRRMISSKKWVVMRKGLVRNCRSGCRDETTTWAVKDWEASLAWARFRLHLRASPRTKWTGTVAPVRESPAVDSFGLALTWTVPHWAVLLDFYHPYPPDTMAADDSFAKAAAACSCAMANNDGLWKNGGFAGLTGAGCRGLNPSEMGMRRCRGHGFGKAVMPIYDPWSRAVDFHAFRQSSSRSSMFWLTRPRRFQKAFPRLVFSCP